MCVYILKCVCVCVCERERERECVCVYAIEASLRVRKGNSFLSHFRVQGLRPRDSEIHAKTCTQKEGLSLLARPPPRSLQKAFSALKASWALQIN